jgi:FdhD protein
VSENTPARSAGPLAPESIVRLVVDGSGTVRWSCTPHDLEELAAGWLVCEGIVEQQDEILGLEASDSAATPTIVARLSPAAVARFASVVDRSAGAAAFPAGRPEGGSARRETAGDHRTLKSLLEDRERLAGLFARMFERAPIRESVGGVHTGGLVREAELVAVVEDVSRHHVVDRLVGRAWLSGVGVRGSVLLLSSRISGAMAAKACRAQIAALVSRSIPSELAASIAADGGLVLVGRAQRRTPLLYRPRF